MANNDSVLPLYVPDTDELEEVFLSTWKLQQFHQQVSILVTWEDCAMADYMVSNGLARWLWITQQMLSWITLALRILEYTLEIQPETEVCQIRNFKHQMIFFSRLRSNHSSTTKVLASPHLWSRTTCWKFQGNEYPSKPLSLSKQTHFYAFLPAKAFISYISHPGWRALQQRANTAPGSITWFVLKCWWK